MYINFHNAQRNNFKIYINHLSTAKGAEHKS